ncbi:MAG: carbohydrate-binding domain-containing protein, partial [Clostridia bacterium]|nr:carbohydrate-binding domain-containing protein [Clostridia bacterium]
MKKIHKFLSAALILCLLAVVGTSVAAADTNKVLYSYGDLFSSRDLQQTADLTGATAYTLADGQDLHITAAGVYVLSGTASDVTVYVEAGKEDKVQLVLDGVSITNQDFPAIYVKSADKVFVTTSGDSVVSVTGTFASDGDIKTDGAIFSKSDLTLNGTGTLTISSTKNGVVSKDDLKVTGGTYSITAASKALEAKDSIRVADGTLDLTAGMDALHAENSDDD